MKTRNRVLCLILAVVLALALCGGALAAVQGSTTLGAYGVWAYKGDNSGELDIDYEIEANHQADSLGISELKIYKSDGTYVTTIYGNTTNRLMAKNMFSINRTYTYKGTPGTTYYAVATVEATIGSDYDSRYVTTNTATTPW